MAMICDANMEGNPSSRIQMQQRWGKAEVKEVEGVGVKDDGKEPGYVGMDVRIQFVGHFVFWIVVAGARPTWLRMFGVLRAKGQGAAGGG